MVDALTAEVMAAMAAMSSKRGKDSKVVPEALPGCPLLDINQIISESNLSTLIDLEKIRKESGILRSCTNF